MTVDVSGLSQDCIWTASGLETARVGFTCGPRVSKTGADGAFINKINRTNIIGNKHGKSNAATSNNDAHS